MFQILTFTIGRSGNPGIFNMGPSIEYVRTQGGRVVQISYTDHAGLKIPVNSRIGSPFSRQIANVNAGPVLAL